MALPTYVMTDMWFRLSLEASQGRIQSAIKNSTTCSSLVRRQQRCQTWTQKSENKNTKYIFTWKLTPWKPNKLCSPDKPTVKTQEFFYLMRLQK